MSLKFVNKSNYIFIIILLCLIFVGSLLLHNNISKTDISKSADPTKTPEQGQKEGMQSISKNTLPKGTYVETPKQQIGIVSMMKSPKNIDTWLETHRQLGITHFYIRLEDTPSVQEYLAEQVDVYMQIGKSTGLNEYTDKQRRQDDWVNEALALAKTDRLDWLIQIDSDELLEGDLDEIRELDPSVRTFWMQNVEAKYAKVPQAADQCFAAAKFTNCAEEPGCVSYANGKGGGRVAADVKASGSHRFSTSIAGSKEPKLSKVIVQHFESCDFELYKEKYRGLAVQYRDEDIPFPYYKDSIEAAKIPGTEGDRAMAMVFEQYRVVNS
jgi:hypothetical protein